METTTVKQWKYVARTQTGKKVKGSAEATSVSAVAKRLTESNLAPISITPTDAGANKEIRLRRSKVSKKQLAPVIRQLSALRSAGFPLNRALESLASQTKNQLLKNALRSCRRSLEQGQTLSEAFANHPRVFPPVVVALVAAGEESGKLEDTMEMAAKSLETDAKIQQKVKSAMVYPAVILSFGALVVTGILLFAVPVFADIYQSFGKPLPFLTQILITISQALKFVVPLTIAAAIAATYWYQKNKTRIEVRRKRDTLLLKLPLFGNLALKTASARFARSLAALQGSGVTLGTSIEIAGRASGLIQIEEACEKTKQKVMTGVDLSKALATSNSPLPELIIQTIEVGEASGQISSLLPQVASFIEGEAEEAAGALQSKLEPIIMAVIGGVVLFILLALYAPIFGLGNVISEGTMPEM